MKLVKNDNIIATEVTKAVGFVQRTVGLLNKTNLSFDEGLFFENCNSIHSFGMKFDFDAIYLDNDNKVVCLIENIKPNKVLPVIFKGKNILETASGSVKNNNIKIGDQLIFEE